MQHKDRLPDAERKARRRESSRKYREANRVKVREASRLSQAKRRQDPSIRDREKFFKQDPAYKARQRLYRIRNRDRLNAKIMEWRSVNADRYSAYRIRYQVENRARTRQRGVHWRLSNADRASSYGKAWRRLNPGEHARHEQNRRARIRAVGGELSTGLYKRLMAAQRGKCAACRSGIRSQRVHIDHIMPIARGGTNTDDNAQLLCRKCNLAKHAKHPVDFMQEIGFLL